MEDHQQQHSFSSSAVDEAYINGLYLGLSFNSMLTNTTSSSSPPVPYSSLEIPKSEPYNFFSDASSSSHQQIPNLLSLPSTAADQIINPNNQRRKRQRSKLNDKVRSLQKLLPVNKKMDMATVLEETYKYVKYLQAQVSVLQCMPEKSTMSGDLSRQEVLRVMVNSAVAQDKMYSSGYSLEQLKEIAQRNHLQANLFNHHHQMMMFDSNPPSYYY